MGVYINRSNVEAMFGLTNTAKWASLQNTDSASEISARIVIAISYAEALFEARLRGSRYKVPLTISSGTGLTDIIISTYAGEWLYRLRVHADDIDPGEASWMNRLVTRADDLLNKLASGSIRIDATLSHSSGTVPRMLK